MIALFALWGCTHETPEPPPAVSIESRVGWSAVGSPDTVPVATLAAEVVAAPSSVVALAPPAAGRLLAWHVQPGDAVVQGQPLADLASPQLSALRARVTTLSSQVREARTSRELAMAAASSGVASQQEVQAAGAELSAAEASLSGARQELAAYGPQAGGQLTWSAPHAGVVGELTCRVGPVQEGVSCLTLQRDRDALLQVRVPARHLAALQAGTSAVFRSLAAEEVAFVEVARSPQLDAATRSLLVQYRTEDAVWVGSAGRAVVSSPRQPELRTVPLAALTRIEGVQSVFVRGGEGPEARPVEVVGGDEAVAVVRGLEGVDEVATRGVFLLKSLAALEAP